MKEFDNRDKYLKDDNFRNMVDFFVFVMENNYMIDCDICDAFHFARRMEEDRCHRSDKYSGFCYDFFKKNQ